MSLSRWRRFGAALLLGVAAIAPALADVPVPALTARITDQTGTLDAQQSAALEQKLAAFEKAKGSQLALLIVPTTEPETIEQYSIRVAEQWKLGRKGVDDGLLILVARNDRTIRIEVGYGLEGVVPDAIAHRVIDEIIVPKFRDGDYYGGLDAGVDQLIKVIDGEPLPPPPDSGSSDGLRPDQFQFFFPLLIAGIFVSQFVRRLLGPGLAALACGGGAFLLIWLLVGLLPMAIFVGIFVAIATLGGVGGGWSSRGGGGFGGGGFGGGGGFSGGGGGFGGGGASGRW